MKILQLCPRIPFPPVDGGTIGMYNLSKALLDHGAYVKVLAFNTSKHYIQETEIDHEYIKSHQLETVFLDNKINIIDAFLNLFTKDSYHISRFKSALFSEQLKQILIKEEFDIIQIDYLPMALYIDQIRAFSKAKIVLRAHNVEHRIWKRLAEENKNILKRWYLRKLSSRLYEFEKNVLRKIDALVSLTEEETVIFKAMKFDGPFCIAPTCFYIDPDIPDIKQNQFSIFHIGAMDWLPNCEGLEWFIREAWPKVLTTFPDLKLYIAGNKMPEKFFQLKSKNINVQGRVADARQFMLEHTLMIVPVFAGSGIRVKIVEGMALGKTIISTSQGAEGLHYNDMENIIIANTADEISEAIAKCYHSEELVRTIGKNARTLALQYYDMRKVGERVWKFYEELAGK